jgi:predicted TIM-barrel fold metal-dependent hydrolase
VDAVRGDLEYAAAYLDAYNRWLAGVCGSSGGRLFGAAMVRFWDPPGMADNLLQVQEMGFRNVVMPTAPPGVRYNAPEMEALWTAIEESGVPLAFHVGEKFDADGAGAFGTSMMTQFHPFRKLWSLLTFSGILERHPHLRVVFTEGGLHWIPGALYDADHLHRTFRSIMEPRLAHEPSYYWFQNCYATFQEDPIGLALIDRIGHEHVLWASDYPHPESSIGHTALSALAVIETVGPEHSPAILNDNARNLWGLAPIASVD